MLRLIDSDERPPRPAYRVPWFVDRTTAGRVDLVNMSQDTLRFVSTQFFDATHVEPARARGDVPPSGALRLHLPSDMTPESCRTTVHWHPPDDQEYAWTFVW